MISFILDRGSSSIKCYLPLLQSKCITIVISNSLLYFVNVAVNCKSRLICIF